MLAGPYCPATVFCRTSAGVMGRIERNSFERSSRTEAARNVALGSIAMVAITCSRWFWIMSASAPASW